MDTKDRITVEEALLVMQQLPMFAQLVQGLKLAEFVRQNNFENSLLPIVDPTAWKRDHGKKEALADLAQSLIAFQNEGAKFMRAHSIPLAPRSEG